MQLRPADVADGVHVLGDPEPLVGRRACRLRASRRSSRAPARRAAGLDRWRAGSRGPRPDRRPPSSITWAPSRPRRHARAWPASSSRSVTPSRSSDSPRNSDGAGVLLVVHAVARMDQRDRHVVARVDLRQLDPGRACAEDGQRARQLAGGGALDVRPRVRLGEPGKVGHPAHRADGEDHGAGLQLAVVDAGRGPGPASVADPRMTVAPASSSDFTWPGVVGLIGLRCD